MSQTTDPQGTMTTIIDIQHHRNGVGGVGAYFATFTNWGDVPDETFLAIISDYQYERYADRVGGNVECYVVSIDRLPDVRFGVNSWRGDEAYHDLVEAGLWDIVDKSHT